MPYAADEEVTHLKHIAIIAFDEYSAELYAGQVRDFFGSYATVEAFFTAGHALPERPAADLYVTSTDAFQTQLDYEKTIPIGAETVEVGVTFTNEAISKLMRFPAGTRALFVSCNSRICIEAIAALEQYNQINIKFVPYYPGVEYFGDPELAITPGESRFVPERIKFMTDIGARILDSRTIVEIALKLKADAVLENAKTKQYFASISDNTYGYDTLFERSLRTERRFDILFELLSNGMIGADENGVIFAFNEKAQQITGLRRESVLGGHVQSLFSYIPFESCKATKKAIEGKLVKHGGMALNVGVSPVMHNGCFLGAFATIQRFSDEEQKQTKLRSQLREKSNSAKYTFDNIISESAAMNAAKDIAKKMAKTSSSVLITGESGTGKELFAHAIHNASARSEMPFVAINCAALPDSLLESELFGYEDGAFTGARRGGKIGLFEYAHLGSLFLDEVEGMSQSLQVKLLRVLQEHEIMHVGGNSAIHIDVRIIATSNERLDMMVENGVFRRDLYYRLNTLPLEIPPLRERREDILPLFRHFCGEISADLKLDDNARRLILNYPWKGNVRELRNCVEYLSFLAKPLITPDDLPPSLSKLKPESAVAEALTAASADASAENAVCLFLLGRLQEARVRRVSMGRDELQKLANDNGIFITQPETRRALAQLREQGFISISRGRGGTKITAAGLSYLEAENGKTGL